MNMQIANDFQFIQAMDDMPSRVCACVCARLYSDENVFGTHTLFSYANGFPMFSVRWRERHSHAGSRLSYESYAWNFVCFNGDDKKNLHSRAQ